MSKASEHSKTDLLKMWSVSTTNVDSYSHGMKDTTKTEDEENADSDASGSAVC